jgi:beta-glucanase (GH16 family)
MVSQMPKDLLKVVAADAKGVPQSIVSPLGKPMTLKFQDEFDPVADTDGQPYIDRSKWKTTFWQGSSVRTLTGNGEAQYYMDKDYGGQRNIPVEQRPNPFSFEKPGILTISATQVPKELWGNYWMGKQRCISSGILCSDGKFIFQYGYLEGRFKLPSQRGSWPALWMLATDPKGETPEKQHPWPPELDVFEYFGHRPSKFTTGYIGRKGEKTKVSQWMHDMGTDLSQDFHTWGLEWDENNVAWTFDGKVVATGPMAPSFRVPMHILVNLAAGGNWYTQEMKTLGIKNADGTPVMQWDVDAAAMPWKMECDYVRVFQAEPGTPPSPSQDTSNATEGGGYHGQNR